MFNSWLPESQDNLPLTWWKQHPVYLAAIIALVGAASMVLTAVLGYSMMGHLIFTYEGAFHHLRLWTPLTYILYNPPSLWTLVGCLLLWNFGEAVERHLGRRAFVRLLLLLLLASPLLITVFGLLGSYGFGCAGITQLEFGVFIAFATLYPRKYGEIESMVNERRADRERFVSEAGETLMGELDTVGIRAAISGRAKHFYSIYEKMTRRGKEFNEIYDLTAMRVLVESDRECYGAIGIIHALWKPMPGRFKDYIAVPKSNGYQSLHTTIIGPHGKPLEIQVRTKQMHQRAEYGVAAHWLYKERTPVATEWLTDLVESPEGESFMADLRTGLVDDEVFVFTPKGELKALAAGATPLDFAYAVHTDVGHRCVGAKVNGRIVPLSATLKSGDIVEVLTSKADRGPSRDWMGIVTTNRARNKIRAWYAREQREDTEQKGRDLLQAALRQNKLPTQRIASSPVLAGVMREMGYRKAEEFYVALGSGNITVPQVIQKLLAHLKTEEVDTAPTPARRNGGRTRALASNAYGIVVDGVGDVGVMVRMAKCCTPVPGDDIVGYISVGRGITIHRGDCPNSRQLARTPERMTQVAWSGEDPEASFRVGVAVEAWDRPRLLEDVGRTVAEHGCNVVEYGGHVSEGMSRNWYVLEIGDLKGLKAVLTALRQIDSVVDAFRVTPGDRD